MLVASPDCLVGINSCLSSVNEYTIYFQTGCKTRTGAWVAHRQQHLPAAIAEDIWKEMPEVLAMLRGCKPDMLHPRHWNLISCCCASLGCCIPCKTVLFNWFEHVLLTITYGVDVCMPHTMYILLWLQSQFSRCKTTVWLFRMQRWHYAHAQPTIHYLYTHSQ